MIELTAVAALGGLTCVLTTGLLLANRVLAVEEDPRVDAVEKMLPATNCGACGHPGCRAFATALVAGEASPGGCTVSSDAQKARIAAYLGVGIGAQARRVARLACAGGDNVARNQARYRGHPSCRSAALVAGGGKGCFYGCLGFGDCERACDFDAIHLDRHGLPHVDEAACTACGDCVEVCPKDLFSLEPAGHHLWVACASHLEGDAVLDECAVGCTACGRCAMDAPGAVRMQAGLPVIDHSLRPPQAAIERCPTGAIVWIGDDGIPRRGDAATPVARRSALPDAPT